MVNEDVTAPATLIITRNQREGTNATGKPRILLLLLLQEVQHAARFRPRPAPHLATEGADVPLVLRDLHLLDHLTQRGAIAGAVLADDPDLLGPLGLKYNNSLLTTHAHSSCSRHCDGHPDPCSIHFNLFQRDQSIQKADGGRYIRSKYLPLWSVCFGLVEGEQRAPPPPQQCNPQFFSSNKYIK